MIFVFLKKNKYLSLFLIFGFNYRKIFWIIRFLGLSKSFFNNCIYQQRALKIESYKAQLYPLKKLFFKIKLYSKLRTFNKIVQPHFLFFFELSEFYKLRFRFILTNCYDYRSFRLSNFLPVRGQRTQTNANTQKFKNFNRSANAKKKYQRHRKSGKNDLKKKLNFCLL